MMAHWQADDDRLIRHWSHVEITCNDSPDYLKHASEQQSTACDPILDLTRVSPFGGAKWYGYALIEHKQRPRPDSSRT